MEWVNWSNIEDALCEMNEDKIGKNIVKKVLKEIGYIGDKAYRYEYDIFGGNICNNGNYY